MFGKKKKPFNPYDNRADVWYNTDTVKERGKCL